MARPINAALSVSEFIATVNPGEYTFAGAIFNNQADATNNGAFDVAVGFVLFIPATDLNLGAPIPGIYHRYKLTAVSVVDASTLNGTVLWDEPGTEQDVPTNNCTVLLAETTPNLKLATLPSDAVYSELGAGSTFQAFSVDQRVLMDNTGGSGPTGTYAKDLLTPNATTGIDQLSLLHTPLDVNRLSLWINGFKYWLGIDYTLTGGTTFNWLNTEFTPNQFDTVIAEYEY